jgi:hypothetical protein
VSHRLSRCKQRGQFRRLKEESGAGGGETLQYVEVFEERLRRLRYEGQKVSWQRIYVQICVKNNAAPAVRLTDNDEGVKKGVAHEHLGGPYRALGRTRRTKSGRHFALRVKCETCSAQYWESR